MTKLTPLYDKVLIERTKKEAAERKAAIERSLGSQ